MKSIFFTVFISLSAFVINAQTVLHQDNGVSLSYSSSFVSTIKCGDKQFNQYKISVYLENNSGHTINVALTYVSHTTYRNQTDVSPCTQPNSSSTEFAENYWQNNSIVRGAYYVLVPSGDNLPEPDWNFGGFTID